MGKRIDLVTVAARSVRRARRRVGGRRVACVVAVAVLVVLSGTVVSAPVAAQEESDSAEVRIVARKLASGRIEFGLQQRQPNNTWGDRQLPRVRFFPTTAAVDRWLASSALELPVGEARIVARKLVSGRIEFGLQQRQGDDAWGDRQLPRVRFFPTTAAVNRWLASSVLALATARPPTTPEPATPEPATPEPATLNRRLLNLRLLNLLRGSSPSPPVQRIRAHCVATGPSPVGAATSPGVANTSGRRRHLPGSSRR